MKKIILSILTLLGFVFIASSCSKRVTCLCTSVDQDNSTNVETFFMDMRKGNCEDGNGEYTNSKGVTWKATCEEVELEDDPEPEDGE